MTGQLPPRLGREVGAGNSPLTWCVISHRGGTVNPVVHMEGKTMNAERPNRPTRAPYTPENFDLVRMRLAAGEYQHDIAADLGWNQGRISEVKTGKRGRKSEQPEFSF